MILKAKRILASIPMAAVAALCAVTGAQAQGALEEIVVTAQKRDQSLQDVSVAVTAVSGDELKALGITDAFRLEILAPGLQLGMSGADPRPALRGARTQQVEANDVAISFYTDGLYRPRHGQALAGFVDVDRVECTAWPAGHAVWAKLLRWPDSRHQQQARSLRDGLWLRGVRRRLLTGQFRRILQRALK